MGLSDSGFYLSVREEKTDFLSNNFASMGGLNLLPFAGSARIRKRLGDHAHINFFQMSLISTLYAKPAIVEDIMRICRLVGYYMVRSPAKKFRAEQILTKAFAGEKEPWRIPANRFVEKILKSAWKKTLIGEVISITADEKEQQIVCQMKDIGCSVKALDSKYCSLAATFCGVAEALTGGIWSGRLTRCQHMGEPYCEIRVSPKDEDFLKSEVDRKEYERILDSVGQDVINHRLAYPRKNLGEYFHMSVPQCTNYLLVSPTIGHSVLSKHSGVVVGEKIAEIMGLDGHDEAFKSAQELFRYLRAGLLENPEKRGDSTSLRMDESVYSSGVKNINTKLDVYPAGIIEGMLNSSTSDKWQVTETKCLANGNPQCEFNCKRVV